MTAPFTAATGAGVLVVDDEAAVACEIAEGLTADGIPATTAGSAEEALDKLASLGDQIGVVLTDLRMPGLDGLGLLRRLHAGNLPPGPEVVVMSGHASREEIEDARRAGATAVLRKPFSWDELDLAIRAALQVVRSRREGMAGAA
jgi:CheY-like chemotaxis protein